MRIVFFGASGQLGSDFLEVAAGTHNKQWNLLHELYGRQGYENGGWVGDELEHAAAAAGVRMHRLEPVAWSAATTTAIARDARAAEVAGVQGTPAFEVGRTGGPLQLVRVTSLDPAGIRPALDAALAR